jgi:hypothetical protein
MNKKNIFNQYMEFECENCIEKDKQIAELMKENKQLSEENYIHEEDFNKLNPEQKKFIENEIKEYCKTDLLGYSELNVNFLWQLIDKLTLELLKIKRGII